MYPCFYSNHWFSVEVAAFGVDGGRCGFLTSFSIDVFYSILPFKLKKSHYNENF
jgi:hypothetical protein